MVAFDSGSVNAVAEALRILLVEDDTEVAELLQAFLTKNGFRCSVEADGLRAPARIVAEKPDLVVLDIVLPGKDGLTICREARADYRGPILMLTARGGEGDEIAGLDIGADDYVAKPVKPKALLARIRALLRRTREVDPSPEKVTVGALLVDSTKRIATIGGRAIDLSSAEFDLLWILVSNAGHVLPRDFLLERLRGESYNGIERSIDLRVSRLRQKIGDPNLIKTVRSVGYLFVRE